MKYYVVVLIITERSVSVQDFGINLALSDRLEGMSADLLMPARVDNKVRNLLIPWHRHHDDLLIRRFYLNWFA